MDDSQLNRLLAVGTDGATVEVKRGRKHDHPTGWQPSLEFDGTQGTATLPPGDGVPNFDDFLTEQGFDPELYEVVGEPRTSRWQRYDGEWLCSYRFNFRRKTALSDLNLEDIVAAAKKAKPKPVVDGDNERVYFVQITDLQAGQADGDGVDGMVARALQIADIVKADLVWLKKSGTPATSIFVPITGDLNEGIDGWYAMQAFSVTLDRRDQNKLVRRVLTEILLSIASLGLPVHVATVPGNHGENRQNGKAYTTLGDNDDVAVVEQVADAFALAGNFGHVTFSFPSKDRLSLTVDVLGWVVGLTHGHVARATGTPAAKILAWFKSMAASRDPIGDSDLLFAGHYHHLIAQQLIGDTWLIQGGALCDASDWFQQTAGLVNDPCLNKGTITRTRMVESLLPYTWNRTKTPARTI